VWRRLAVIAALVLGTSLGRAAPASVIGEGREAEVLALFAPYRLGGEVVEGWRLWNVRIEQTRIEVELRGPGDAPATFELGQGPARERTPSFAVRRRSGAVGATTATNALVEAVRRNDHGGIWRALPPPADRATPPPAAPPVSLPVALAVPALVAAASALAMWSVARRKAV
jgi:hypothetical protein